MASLQMFITLFLLLSQVPIISSSPVTASGIQDSFCLKVKPVTIVGSVTPNVTLRCENTRNISNELSQVSIIRILRQVNNDNWSLVAQIRDNDETVASYDDDVTASASLDEIASSSFLEIKWEEATPETFGTYRCQVVGFTTSLDVVTVTTPELHVTENEVTVQGLLDYFLAEKKETEERFDEQAAKIDQVERKLKGDIQEMKQNGFYHYK